MKSKSIFENEAALCAAFIAALPKGWIAYPETAGFDILLVRVSDGAQVGVEAKMTLNAKVLLQAVEAMYSSWHPRTEGPDFRAALVPYGTAGMDLATIAGILGVTVIQCRAADEGDIEVERQVARYGEFYRKYATREYKPFVPDLPGPSDWRERWVDLCPLERCKVPEYVPDVIAGASGPSQLSEWKIKAIKICIVLERRGYLTPQDFAHISIHRKRWHDMGWISHDHDSHDRGRFIAGNAPLNLRAAHPVNYAQIEADFDKWAPTSMLPDEAPKSQESML